MRRLLCNVSVVVAVVVLVATVVQAVRERSLGPVWSIGWMPAVLAGTLLGTRRGRCARRGERAQGR